MSSAAWGNQQANTNQGGANDEDAKLEYICGNCGFRNKIGPNSKIRCVPAVIAFYTKHAQNV